MKIIGQQTWDFLTRFKGDVYLDSLTESTQTHVVGIGADGKLYKQDGGDITGVTITTDSGGGSKAEDSGGSADFSILGASGVGVTNSGTTITAAAVPGEIDHDSLLNFVTAEHYRWDNDISGTATIHTNNITDLHGAGVDGAANQLLTDDGDGSVTSEAGLTFQRPGFGYSWLVFPSVNNASDYLRIQVGDHGASRIDTVDADGIEANLNIDADGELELQSTGQMTLDSSSSIELNADGGTISFKDGGTTLGTITSSGWSGTSAKTIVTDSTANTNFPVVFHDESNGLLDDTGAFLYNPNTGTLLTKNLIVDGTTTTINTTDLNVEDKNITLNYHATNDTSASADGAGITVQDAVDATTNATINWNATDDTWDFSHRAILPDRTRIDTGRLQLGSSSLYTELRHNTLGSSKGIDLPNISGSVGVMDIINSAYTVNNAYPQNGVYTQIVNLTMAEVYGLNNAAHDIIPDGEVHGSQTMMLLGGWVYVVTPNYAGGVGVANTANVYLQFGKTSGHGTYNKAKGFEGSISRLAYNQPSNRTNIYRIIQQGSSSDYGNPEPGLGLKVWTNVDPTGSASSGSESITSMKLIVRYTIIPS